MSRLTRAAGLTAVLPLAGCELIGNIFEAGVWTGVIIVVAFGLLDVFVCDADFLHRLRPAPRVLRRHDVVLAALDQHHRDAGIA